MNEETLLFYYYGDGLSEPERGEVRLALARDPALAADYARLCAELDGLGDLPTATVAPPGLAGRLHALVDDAADSAAGDARDSWWSSWSPFNWGVAVAAALVLGIAIGNQFAGPGALPDTGSRGPLPYLPGSAGVPAPDGGSAFTRGLMVHFDASRSQLAALDPQGNGERARMVLELVRQNRLFERAATRQGVDDLARLLRALEPVLLQLAEPGLAPQRAADLRAQLEFELNVVLTRLLRDASEEAGTTNT